VRLVRAVDRQCSDDRSDAARVFIHRRRTFRDLSRGRSRGSGRPGDTSRHVSEDKPDPTCPFLFPVPHPGANPAGQPSPVDRLSPSSWSVRSRRHRRTVVVSNAPRHEQRVRGVSEKRCPLHRNPRTLRTSRRGNGLDAYCCVKTSLGSSGPPTTKSPPSPEIPE